mgnify:CR=1 FL=1
MLKFRLFWGINTLFQDNNWHFIFDVDGCITPKGEPINDELYYLVLSLASQNRVSIVTGSELFKTIGQIGENLVQNLYMCFTCMGNVVYKDGKITEQNFWYPEKHLVDFLWEFICFSKFPYRTAHHFDLRTGSMNVSVIGRNATPLQRQEYLDYDLKSKERLRLADMLIKNFNNIEVSIGGNTSIDICPKNKNKSQIIKYITENKIVFFGDGYGKWGNDQPLFDALKNLPHSISHKVDDWRDTLKIIQTQYLLFLPSKKQCSL